MIYACRNKPTFLKFVVNFVTTKSKVMETETYEEKKKVDEAVCCPPFDPDPWEDKMHMWERKQFIHDRVNTFFYMPLNFGKAMRRLNKKVEAAGADVPNWLCLSDHTSKWNMDLYLEVDRDVPDAENVTISGNFYSKVYEGPFKDTEKWAKDFNQTLEQKGLTSGKIYMWYTTCPKCAKKYGKNYCAFIAEIKPQ
jgi:hypothetical protein